MCPLNQGNPILSQAAIFQNNGNITNPSRHPAVMSGNSLAALMPLMAWRGFPGHFPNDLLAFSGTFTGVSNQALPTAHPPKISCSIKPWNGLGWDEPHRSAGSTLLPRFLQSSILPGQAFPSAGALQHPRNTPTPVPPHSGACSPFSLVPDTVAGMATRTLSGVDSNVLSTWCWLCFRTAGTLCLKFLVEGRCRPTA